jgi:molybdenum cofactor cytidylyltransferase
MTIVALLLAAGESTRMGSPKPLLDWGGTTLIEYQIHELLAAGVDDVVAVLGHRSDEVRPAAERAGARVAINAAYRDGRAGSIRVGAGAVGPSVSAIVILNVDQPRDRSITRALLESHAQGGALITVPAYGSRRGHPAVLSGSLLDELRAVDEASEGLNAVMRRHAAERRELALDDSSVLSDLNRPADYEAARRAQPPAGAGT